MTDNIKLETVIKFLLGEGPLHGYHFSEKPEGAGNYWWRTHLREAVRLNAAPVPDEPNWSHPKIQGLIGSEARLRIAIDLVWKILEDPNQEFSAGDMEYWDTLHDDLKAALAAAPEPQGVPEPADWRDAYEGAREDLSIWKRRALEAERDLRAEKEISSRLVAEINATNGPTFMGEPTARRPQQSGAAQPEVQERNPLWHQFDQWYWKAVTSSAPDHWMQAALVARRIFKGMPRKEAQPEQERKPLSDDEVVTAFCNTSKAHQFVEAFMEGVRFAERHHGITKESP